MRLQLRARWFSLVLVWLLCTAVCEELLCAEDRVLIKLGTIAPEGSSWHDALLRIRQDWRQISGGEVELRIYASGVLGDEAEMIRKVRRRQLDAVAVSGAGLARVDKSVECLNIPLMFASYEEFDYTRGKLAPELEKRIATSNFKVLNWSDAGWVHFFSKEPAYTPTDIENMKLWTASGDPDTEKLFKDLGFQVIPLPATDMLTALQTGLIEVIEVPPLFAMLDGTYKQADNMIDLKWVPLIVATVIDVRAWNRIPVHYHSDLLNAARKAGDRLRATIRAAGDDAVEEMKTRGLNVITLTDVERKHWQSEVEDAYPTLRRTLVPTDLFDQVLELRNEFRSRQRSQVQN